MSHDDSLILTRLLIFPHHVTAARLSGLPIENVLHVVHIGLVFLKWVLGAGTCKTLSYLFSAIAGHEHLSHVTDHGRAAIIYAASFATTNDLFDVRIAV